MAAVNPDDFLREWARLINARDLDRVLALYGDGAVLIPTFSNRLLSRPERIREYFEMLYSRDQLSITLHDKPRTVSTISDRIHALAGIYRWRFSVEDEPLDFEARYSFILDLERPAPILHHHSSQIPRML
jgi:hypothetical protein